MIGSNSKAQLLDIKKQKKLQLLKTLQPEKKAKNQASNNGEHKPSQGKHAATTGGEPRALRSEPAVQHIERRDVRHIRQVRRHSADPSRHEQGHSRHRLRRLRGHLRRQDRRRSPLRVQRRQPLPHRAVLPASQDEQEVRSQEEGGRDYQASGKVWCLHQR